MKNKFYVGLMEFGGRLVPYDILPYLSEEWGKLKPSQKKVEDLKSWVDKELRYQFWGRCEYEMLVSSWPPRKDEKPLKIDIYQQASLNLELITKLFIENEGIS